MPPNTPSCGSARSAAALNEQIRALWISAGGVLTAEQKQLYDDLVVEWAEAKRGEVAEAA